jgi:hypothetical protein
MLKNAAPMKKDKLNMASRIQPSAWFEREVFRAGREDIPSA